MPRYLINLTDENAARLESWPGTGLRIGPAWEDTFKGVLIASLDAVADEELEPARQRLAAGVPMYHPGGPPVPSDRLLMGCNGTCGATARRSYGTGICGRPLDELGQCDRASDHIE